MRSAAVGHQCPACVAEGRRTQRQARTAFGGSHAGERGYVTKALIAINTVMLLLSVISAGSTAALAGGQGFGGLLGGSTPLMSRLAVEGRCQVGQGALGQAVYQACGVAHGEYYRLFTAMFMHFGVVHLVLNMWALWVLGRVLEQMLGPGRFLALYLVAGLGGDVAVYLFQPVGLSAGASTAIFGMFAALLLALRRLRLDTSSVLPIIVINLIFTFGVHGIALSGHLGGLVTGAVAGAGLAYAPRANRTLVQASVLAGTVVLLGGLSLWQTSLLAA